MATRSRTQIFVRYRDSLRTHKGGLRTKTTLELNDFKVDKALFAAQSDDEGTIDHPLAYSIPPYWVTMVDDMNRDISKIKIKSARIRARFRALYLLLRRVQSRPPVQSRS